MICRSTAEAFEAGMAAACDHGDDPVLCPACRLTTDEISDLAVLHRGLPEVGASSPLAA